MTCKVSFGPLGVDFEPLGVDFEPLDIDFDLLREYFGPLGVDFWLGELIMNLRGSVWHLGVKFRPLRIDVGLWESNLCLWDSILGI